MAHSEQITEIFASRVFSEDVMEQRLPREVFDSLRRTIASGSEIDPGIADAVAAAMKDWAVENGATHFSHWFQPLSGVTAEKHDAFLTPIGGGKAIMDFSGKELIRGEPDASSFPSGGLRATFEARGYTAWDPASYAFIKDGSLYIPTAFCSYTGEALDNKTPLLRSMDALNAEGVRLFSLIGEPVERLTPTVGAEQEYFLLDEKDYKARRDLYYCGRTLFGAPAVKGQELDDHYFGVLPTKVSMFMRELDLELWRLGIPAKTKHNEAAPAQHELAPIYTTVNIAVDQNLLMMECMKKLAPKYGMTCLLSEKPFDGINGSGKHNNWSLTDERGDNLLKPGHSPEKNKRFLLILAAVLRAVDEYQDLLRVSAATAGNDYRLGGNEAPPAIVSVFLGGALEDLIDSFIEEREYLPHRKKDMSLGARAVPPIRQDTADRNRTSPFAFTGNKFEFRMLGSSQNIALANIVLNTAVADSFAEFADRLAAADDRERELRALLADTFRAHRRILFSGNSYSPEWEAEAGARGLSILRTAPEAYERFAAEKNVALFERFGVMSRTEILSRREVFFDAYRKIRNIEARTMLEMTIRDFIPAVSRYLSDLSRSVNERKAALPSGANCGCEEELIRRLSVLLDRAYRDFRALERAEALAAEKRESTAAFYYKDQVMPKMAALRRTVDEMETLTARDYWPVPTYGDLTYPRDL